MNIGRRFSSAVIVRLSSPVRSMTRRLDSTSVSTMEVKGSTGRTSVFTTPEPSILLPLPPVVMQSPHSDQSQAVRKSRADKTAANRNMTQSSNDVDVVSIWRGVTAVGCALVGERFLFDGARAGHSRLEFRRTDVPDGSGT